MGNNHNILYTLTEGLANIVSHIHIYIYIYTHIFAYIYIFIIIIIIIIITKCEVNSNDDGVVKALYEIHGLGPGAKVKP